LPDLVILDLGLPLVSGRDIHREDLDVTCWTSQSSEQGRRIPCRECSARGALRFRPESVDRDSDGLQGWHPRNHFAVDSRSVARDYRAEEWLRTG
jgi:hypothetical protein